MPCFPYEHHRKLFQSLIKQACAGCHCSCLKIPSRRSEDDEMLSDSDIDIDSNKHVIILEIISRAMRAKLKPKFEYSIAESLHWDQNPNSGKLLIASKGSERRKEGNDEDNDDDNDESEEFYSVKSCFSRCSSAGLLEPCKDYLRGQSVWEEFCHCEGWPFGLHRRRAAMLPPLPSSPSDSWTWRKRKLVACKV